MLSPDRIVETLVNIGYSPEHPEHARLVEAARALAVTLGSYELPEEAEDNLLDLLSSAGRDELNKLPQLGEEVWEDFNYGNVYQGDFVRVKKDAYDSDTGSLHNGRVGVMTFMRSGRCRVKYVGLSAGKTSEHPKEKLDSLKRGVK